MADQSYLARKISFRIFERKEIQNNKRVSLDKYKSMDAFDQDRNFWNMMSAPVQSDRGYFSRKIPLTPLTWKHDEDEELKLLGNLEKRPMNDIIDEVRTLTDGVCVNNGFIDLKKIDWSNAFQEEEIEEINNIKDNKYKRIESKKTDKADLTVKK